MENIYHVPKEEIANTLGQMAAMRGVEIVQDMDLIQLLALWPANISDFGDAVLAVFCKTRKDGLLHFYDVSFIKAASALGIKIHR